MTRWPRGTLTGFLVFVVAVITSVGTSEPETAQTISVANGIRYTVAGARIDAHSGTILRAQDGFFYWYGEAYACGFHWTDPQTPYCGAQAYRSPDMSRWQGPWPLFDASTAIWQDLCMHQLGAPGNGCFRPKVVYNRATRLYVLWLNTGGFTSDGYRVLTSRAPLGPFTMAAKPELHDGAIADWQGNLHTQDGDEGLFVDAGGTGWLTWSRGGRLLQERLNASYTSGTGAPAVIMNYPQFAPWAGVESPSPTVAFHCCFNSLGHVCGAVNPVTFASRFGPRHCGQSAARRTPPPKTHSTPAHPTITLSVAFAVLTVLMSAPV